MSQWKIHEKTYSEKHRKITKNNQNELQKSIKNRSTIDVLGRCLPAGLQNVDFGGPGWIFRFSGMPREQKLIKKRRKNCLTKGLKKTLCHAEFLSHVILSRSQCHTAAAEGAKLSTISFYHTYERLQLLQTTYERSDIMMSNMTTQWWLLKSINPHAF